MRTITGPQAASGPPTMQTNGKLAEKQLTGRGIRPRNSASPRGTISSVEEASSTTFQRRASRRWRCGSISQGPKGPPGQSFQDCLDNTNVKSVQCQAFRKPHRRRPPADDELRYDFRSSKSAQPRRVQYSSTYVDHDILRTTEPRRKKKARTISPSIHL